MDDPPRRLLPLALVCGLWLTAFTAVFFLVTLPNNPTSRLAIVDELPDVFRTAIPNTTTEGVRYLPQRLPLLAVAGAVLAGAWGLGELSLRLARLPLPTWSLDRGVFAAGLGLSLLSLGMLGLGLLGAMSPLLLGTLLATALVAALIVSVLRPLRREPSPPLAPPSAPLLLNGLSTLFVVIIVLGACLPSFDFDVNAYHFPGPKEWSERGRITFLPHNVYTSFPFLTEMLVLAGMILKQDWNTGALAGKVLLSAYAPLTALGLYCAGRRWFSPLAGGVAALVYVSAPWTYRISTIAYVEGALSFYLLATVWALALAWDEARRAGQLLNRWLLLAGLMAGSGMACKYPGLVSVVIPASLAAAGVGWVAGAGATRSPGERRATIAFGLAAFALGVVVTIGPWLLKNLVETGNPVYPLAWNVFGGRDWDAASNDKWNRGHFSHSFTLAEASRALADVTLLNDWLSPLLFGLAPLSLLMVWLRRKGGHAGSMSLGMTIALWVYLVYLVAAWWLFTHRIDRFFVPQHPVVALLAGIGMALVVTELRRSWPMFAWLGAMSVFNLGIVLSGFANYSKLFIDLKEAEAEAITMTAPEIGWLNAHLPANARVLCVGEAETFYARFPLVYNTVFDTSVFEEWCATPAGHLRPSDEIRERFRAEKITHVYVNWRELLRYRATYGYTDFVTREKFTELQEGGVLGEALYVPASRAPAEALWERNPGWKPHVDFLGKDLLVPSGNQTLLRTFEVFPVLSSPFPATSP